MKRFLIYSLALIALSSCRDKRIVVPEIVPPAVDGSMLYANEFGALRLVKTAYENNRLSTVSISPFADVGFGDTLSFSTVFSALGGVARSASGSFDWSYFDDKNPPYAAAVLVLKNNGIGSGDHKTQSVYQWVGINQIQRSQNLFMNSVINGNIRRPLVEFNYYVRARNVRFIDRTSYLVSFTDYWHAQIGKPRPSNIGVDDFVHYIMRFDFAAPDPTIGEVIASFNDQHMGLMQLHVSAKKNFVTIFAPRYETTGISPYVMHMDGRGYAYTPQVKGNQGYNRAPGNEAFALEAHPTKDSILAVSDINYGTVLLQVPRVPEDRFEIVSPALAHSQIVPTVPIAEVFNQGVWQIRFNHDGSRLAISSWASSGPVTVAVWHVNENRLVKYTVPNVQGVSINRIGKPAWDMSSPDKRFLYFFATDDRTKRGFMFYVDTDNTTALSATAIPWDSIRFSDDLIINAEQIRTPSEIIARKDKP